MHVHESGSQQPICSFLTCSEAVEQVCFCEASGGLKHFRHKLAKRVASVKRALIFKVSRTSMTETTICVFRQRVLVSDSGIT